MYIDGLEFQLLRKETPNKSFEEYKQWAEQNRKNYSTEELVEKYEAYSKKDHFKYVLVINDAPICSMNMAEANAFLLSLGILEECTGMREIL